VVDKNIQDLVRKFKSLDYDAFTDVQLSTRTYDPDLASEVCAGAIKMEETEHPVQLTFKYIVPGYRLSADNWASVIRFVTKLLDENLDNSLELVNVASGARTDNRSLLSYTRRLETLNLPLVVTVRGPADESDVALTYVREVLDKHHRDIEHYLKSLDGGAFMDTYVMNEEEEAPWWTWLLLTTGILLLICIICMCCGCIWMYKAKRQRSNGEDKRGDPIIVEKPVFVDRPFVIEQPVPYPPQRHMVPYEPSDTGLVPYDPSVGSGTALVPYTPHQFDGDIVEFESYDEESYVDGSRSTKGRGLLTIEPSYDEETYDPRSWVPDAFSDAETSVPSNDFLEPHGKDASVRQKPQQIRSAPAKDRKPPQIRLAPTKEHEPLAIRSATTKEHEPLKRRSAPKQQHQLLQIRSDPKQRSSRKSVASRKQNRVRSVNKTGVNPRILGTGVDPPERKKALREPSVSKSQKTPSIKEEPLQLFEDPKELEPWKIREDRPKQRGKSERTQKNKQRVYDDLDEQEALRILKEPSIYYDGDDYGDDDWDDGTCATQPPTREPRIYEDPNEQEALHLRRDPSGYEGGHYKDEDSEEDSDGSHATQPPTVESLRGMNQREIDFWDEGTEPSGYSKSID